MKTTVTDELDSIVRAFCETYPNRSAEEVDLVVHDVYARLASQATVTAHLIPLTVNRCHKVLNTKPNSIDGGHEPISSGTMAS